MLSLMQKINCIIENYYRTKHSSFWFSLHATELLYNLMPSIVLLTLFYWQYRSIRYHYLHSWKSLFVVIFHDFYQVDVERLVKSLSAVIATEDPQAVQLQSPHKSAMVSFLWQKYSGMRNYFSSGGTGVLIAWWR